MNNNKEEIVVTTNSPKYQQASIKLRHAWLEYKNREEVVKYEIVNMMQILEKDGYGREEAIQKIIADHKDLDGFSRKTIYRKLPEEMKSKELGRPNMSRDILGQPNTELEKFRKQKGTQVETETNVQNNVIEDDVDKRCQHNVLEDSSTIGNHELQDELEPVPQDDEDDLNEAIDAVDDVDPIEAEPHIQYDDPQKIILQLKQRIIKLMQHYKFEYTVIYKDQEIPLVVTSKPEIKSGMVEIDQKKSEK
ncbi:MAG TPA: hypothetical protein VLA74_10825 [Nitrososphaeraceae archaeon]|nr:hypothetical protein [Nitrososphaeraceae archaeon]